MILPIVPAYFLISEKELVPEFILFSHSYLICAGYLSGVTFFKANISWITGATKWLFFFHMFVEKGKVKVPIVDSHVISFD